MIDPEKAKWDDFEVSNAHPPTEEDFREISAFIKAQKEKRAAEEKSKKALHEKSRPLPLRTALNKPQVRS